MLINQAAAKIDFFTTWLPLIVMLSTVAVNWVLIKKAKKEEDDEIASKEYVDNKIETVNLNMKNIKDTIKTNKIAMDKTIEEHLNINLREHDAIKKEFISKVDMIFDWIKEKSD